MSPSSILQPASWATTDSAAPNATVLALEAVSQGNLFWQNSRCLIVGSGMVQQIYQLALGWGQGKGGSGERGREEMKCVCVCWGGGFGHSDGMRFWVRGAGRGRCGGWGRGAVTIRRRAGVRRSVTSSPGSSMEGVEVWAAPQRRGKLHRKSRRGFRGKGEA